MSFDELLNAFVPSNETDERYKKEVKAFYTLVQDHPGIDLRKVSMNALKSYQRWFMDLIKISFELQSHLDRAIFFTKFILLIDQEIKNETLFFHPTFLNVYRRYQKKYAFTEENLYTRLQTLQKAKECFISSFEDKEWQQKYDVYKEFIEVHQKSPRIGEAFFKDGSMDLQRWKTNQWLKFKQLSKYKQDRLLEIENILQAQEKKKYKILENEYIMTYCKTCIAKNKYLSLVSFHAIVGDYYKNKYKALRKHPSFIKKLNHAFAIVQVALEQNQIHAVCYDSTHKKNIQTIKSGPKVRKYSGIKHLKNTYHLITLPKSCSFQLKFNRYMLNESVDQMAENIGIHSLTLRMMENNKTQMDYTRIVQTLQYLKKRAKENAYYEKHYQRFYAYCLQEGFLKDTFSLFMDLGQDYLELLENPKELVTSAFPNKLCMYYRIYLRCTNLYGIVQDPRIKECLFQCQKEVATLSIRPELSLMKIQMLLDLPQEILPKSYQKNIYNLSDASIEELEEISSFLKSLPNRTRDIERALYYIEVKRKQKILIKK